MFENIQKLSIKIAVMVTDFAKKYYSVRLIHTYILFLRSSIKKERNLVTDLSFEQTIE